MTSNVPIGIARRCAAHLDVVLVTPAQRNQDHAYRDAVQIAVGVFATMQRSLLELQVRLASSEPDADDGSRAPVQVDVVRPRTALPGTLLGFDVPGSIEAMWQRGYADGRTGFAPYTLPAQR